MYQYEEGIFGLGYNGKSTVTAQSLTPPQPPSGPTTQAEIDRFIQQHRGYEAAQAAQQEAAFYARSRERVTAISQALDNPVAWIGLCTLGAIPVGAIIGALASPKGERGGGAKWGILASMAVCPAQMLLGRFGTFGGVLNAALTIGAPIVAARYRLKHKT